jgi:hypothetical protein
MNLSLVKGASRTSAAIITKPNPRTERGGNRERLEKLAARLGWPE